MLDLTHMPALCWEQVPELAPRQWAQINVLLVRGAQRDPKALEATAVPASLLVPCSAIGPSHVLKAFTNCLNQTCSLPALS